MSAMVLEPNYIGPSVSDSAKSKIGPEKGEELVSTWSPDLERRYTLYEVFPQVLNLPPFHAVVAERREVAKDSGDFVTSSELANVGSLSFWGQDISESFLSELVEKGFGPERYPETDRTSTEPLDNLETAITSVPLEESVEAIEGNLVTLSVTSTDVLDRINDDDYPLELEGYRDLFELLVDSDEYPLERAGSNESGETQYHYTAQTFMTDVLREDTSLDPFLHEAIDDYQNGIFMNHPTMSIVFALSKAFDQSAVARMCGIDSSTVSRHVSKAEDMVHRATHTSNKYEPLLDE